MIKFSDLKGRAVVQLENSEKIGEISDVLMDSASHQPVGIELNPGLLSHNRAIPMTEIKSIGPAAIMVSNIRKENDLASGKFLKLGNILNNQVVTDTGELLGNIKDIALNPDTLEMIAFEVSSGGLFAKTREFVFTPDIRFGEKLVTIPNQLVAPPGQKI
jgi:uncharacterized protein YrrD